MSVTAGEKWDPGPASDTPESPPNQDQTAEPSSQGLSEERIRELLEAYQETLDIVEKLPAVVWVPWDRNRPGSYFKVPYLRWFLEYFVVHHIGRSLDTLDRHFHAIAAISGNPDANRTERETVTLYLRSLPRLPYLVLIFAAVLAALVIALPLQGFGNVFYVLDLVGAMMRFDVTYVGRAFEGKKIGPTVRSFIVLLIGRLVVASLITSPFGLKRIIFNLHPWTRERLDSTAARGHGFRVEGLYVLEDRLFKEAGIRRPHEGRWDLVFQTFLLSSLLLLGLLMAILTLAVLLSLNVNLDLDTGAPAEVDFMAPQVSWVYYALFTGLVLAAFVILLKRLVSAWKKRSRKRDRSTPPGASM